VPQAPLEQSRKRKLGRSHEEGKCQNGKSSKAPLLEIGKARTELAKLVGKQGVFTSTDADFTALKVLNKYKTTLNSTKHSAHLFEDISMAEDGHQIIVSTLAESERPIYSRRIIAGTRSTQLA
jgi:hypothetical protein